MPPFHVPIEKAILAQVHQCFKTYLIYTIFLKGSENLISKYKFVRLRKKHDSYFLHGCNILFFYTFHVNQLRL